MNVFSSWRIYSVFTDPPARDDTELGSRQGKQKCDKMLIVESEVVGI